MKPVRVMIVDDEILAIEHIRQLVSWEQLGYEIVCTATKPSQALELVQKHNPELVIADIVMPGLDGLALSKQLLSIAPIVKIVLLTSYKEFDYAKEAVKLGVSNYWVKHEMDKDTLTRELGSLRIDIVREIQRREEDRRRLLGEWLAGNRMSDEQWRTAMIGQGTSVDRMNLIVLQPDRPFPLLAGLAAELPPEAPILPADWPEHEADGLVAAIRYREDTFVLLLEDSGGRGEARTRELLEEKAAEARDLLERTIGGTVSIAVAVGLRGYAEAPGRLAELLRLKSLSVFFGARHSIRSHENRPEDTPSKPLAWEEGVDRIRNRVAEMRFEDAGRELTDLFNEASSSRDLVGFTDMCRQLVNMLNRARVTIQLPSYQELWEQKRISASDWISCETIRTWFLSELEAISTAGRGQMGHSRKIRQAQEYMEKHFADGDLGADSIAGHLGISRDYFRHVYKEETGQTVLDRLTDIRMEHAKKMLDEGKYKVYEIAERVGFRNSQYFSQVFRKVTGMNPLEYMERRR